MKDPASKKWTCRYCGTSITAASSPDSSPAASLVNLVRDWHEPICARIAVPDAMANGEWSIEYGQLFEDGRLYGPTPDLTTAERRAKKADELGMDPRPMGQQRVWRERATEVIDA